MNLEPTHKSIQAEAQKRFGGDEGKKKPVYRGCGAIGGCFCTGRCKGVIGYWVDGEYEPVSEMDMLSVLKRDEARLAALKRLG